MAFYNWKKHSKLTNFALGIDQMFNTFFNIMPWPLTWPGVGNPDRSISFTLGKLQKANNGVIPWKYPIAKLFAFVCDKIEPDHCIKAFKNGT